MVGIVTAHIVRFRCARCIINCKSADRVFLICVECPGMAQRIDVLHFLRLRSKRCIRERRRVRRLALAFAGRRRRHFARRIDCLGLYVALIIPADTSRRYRAVISRPLIGRVAPSMARRRDL